MKNFLSLILTTAVCFTVMAQKLKNQTGNLKFMKGVDIVNVVFDYADMKLLKENNTEKQYILNRTKELNKKVEGSGDIWKKQWERSPEELWNPKFITILNKTLEKEGLKTKLKEGVQSPYTLTVKT